MIGVPDEVYGEQVMAWVILKPGESCDEEELRANCDDQIAYFKIPRYWRFTDSFPMTVTGKIQKFLMREQAISDLHLEGAAAVRTA